MKKIIIIGGKGNGTVVLSAIEEINAIKEEWKILGFLNDKEVNPISGYPILGKIDKETVSKYLADENVYFYYALLSIKLNHHFLYRLRELEIPLQRFATIIHPSAIISKEVTIGYGCCILQNVSINRYSTIGNFVQILSHVVLATSATLDDFSYVAANAYVGAYCHLKEGAYMGPCSSIIEFRSMSEWSIAGMGAVIIRDVPPYIKVAGNPAKQIGTNE